MTRYIFPVLLILLALAINSVSIQPLYAEILQVRAQSAEVKQALIETETARAKLNEITKRYESFPPDADEKLAEIFPEKIDPIRLLIDTKAFLERNGFPVKSLAVGETLGANSDDAPYRTHQITFSLSASYDSFRGFLHALEESLALRDLATISFTAAPGAKEYANVRPELTIHDYTITLTSYSLH